MSAADGIAPPARRSLRSRAFPLLAFQAACLIAVVAWVSSAQRAQEDARDWVTHTAQVQLLAQRVLAQVE